jgi:hypothetical protein
MGAGSAIRSRAGLPLLALMALLALLLAAPSAHAQFGVDPDAWIAQVYGGDDDGHDVEDTASDQYGVDGIYDQAGGHPWKGITDFTFRDTAGDTRSPDGGNVENLRVDVPAGLVPNPTIFPRCARALFLISGCPPNTQIGIEELTVQEGTGLTAVRARIRVPLYNLEIGPGEVSVFAFHPADAAPLVPGIAGLAGLNPVFIVGGVRDQPSQFGPHDNGLFFTIDDAPESPALLASKLTFWGVPGDPAHDAQRDEACAAILAPAPFDVSCPGTVSVLVPDRDVPFLTNPTKCDGLPRITRLSVWSHAGAFDTVDDPTPWIQGKNGPQHCERVPFGAGIDVVPNTTQPDAPVGPRVHLTTPQQGLHDKDVLTTSHVKDVSVTLPPGMTLNPSAANGLAACTDAQLAAGTGEVGGDECPEASKVGTVDVKSPLLPDSVVGSAFVGQPLPGDKYRMFVTLEGRGVSIRLKGSVKPDPGTGQLTATFQNNPELPFDTFDVDLEDGPRAPLANPLDCGPKTASGVFTPWSGTPPVTASGGFTVGSAAGCPAPFEPGFGAGTATPVGGAFSPFTASISRADRNQYLSRVTVKTPPGLAGMISNVEQCADALAAQGACPASSRIGTATTSSGAGPEPFALSGPVYLTGPYKGAPFGMVAVIRAIAGPYDLGTVVVRESIFVDPEDAHLTVTSDPLPTILEGVPIRLRTIDVAIDRKDFVYNPTSCGPKEVEGTLHSTAGAAARRTAGFQLAGCEKLGFTPKMSMQLIGPRQMGVRKHPGLKTRVTQPRRQASIGKARVKLPLSLALDPGNANAICGFEASLRADCPKKSIIGNAKAVSPALNRPLTGPVYFVQGIRIDPKTGARIRTLPSLLAKLHGEIRVNLRGTTAVEKRKLVSTFDRVPDAPVTDFELTLRGGKSGILIVTGRRGLCGRRQVTLSQLTGHNGKRANSRVKMVKPCKRPGLKVKRVRVSGNRVQVRGTIARSARKRVKVAIRCGKTRIVKQARHPKSRRWKTTLKLRGRCTGASRAKLRVSYPGGGKFAPALRRRSISL